MTVEEALIQLTIVLQPKPLNDVQELVFCKSWEGSSYKEIAAQAGYDAEYIKLVGFQLWKLLSKAFGVKVTKSNIHSVLTRNSLSYQPLDNADASQATYLHSIHRDLVPSNCSQDGKEAIDVSLFYGRAEELDKLETWILEDKCRLIEILGIGGVGKTALSVKLAEIVQKHFDFVIWHRLHNSLSVGETIAKILKDFSPELQINSLDNIPEQLSLLLQYLKQHRCLLVLDNFEAIINSANDNPIYHSGYEDYRQMLRRLAEERHNSCLVITSRETPEEVIELEGEFLPVRILELKGIDLVAAKKLLLVKGLTGTDAQITELVNCYQGIPLALKIATTFIKDIYLGNIGEFLSEKITGLKQIRQILDDDFNRLSVIEKQVMYWLGIKANPLMVNEIQAVVVPPVTKQELLEVLSSLRRRSLIENTSEGFIQQPFVREFINEKFKSQAKSVKLKVKQMLGKNF
ncbi:NB-ARC domain-containing protein [Floridanema aerugineum]|uniref:NB-ARC domain-containing protein n=1 Tax=Floridaenema aerugineum BLCC-F46 TaxID=3153654 RepID=A0ABV4X2F0_9CYAN